MTNLFSIRSYTLLLFFFILVFSSVQNKAAKLYARGDSASDGSVNIYSPQGEGDVAYIQRAAEKRFDFPINILRVDGGALADRLLAEKNNPQVDLVFGITQLSMEQLKTEGVFEKYTPKWAAQLPPAYQDKEGYYYGFWQTPIVLVYNPAFLSLGQTPKSWLDLIKPEYKNKFMVGATQWQTTRVYLAGIMWRFCNKNTGVISPQGWDFIEALYGNAKPLEGAGKETYQFLKTGKLWLNPHWYGGAVRGAAEAGFTPAFINTEGGTPVISESIALTPRGNQNPMPRPLSTGLAVLNFR